MVTVGRVTYKPFMIFFQNAYKAEHMYHLNSNSKLRMEGGKSYSAQNVPTDTYNIAYIVHFMLGAGNLLPWNALITAVDYFGYLYPSKHIDKVFSVAYMTSSLPVLVLMLNLDSWCKIPSYRWRMNLGLAMFVLSLLTPTVLDWSCHTHGPNIMQDGAYSVIVASVVVCGLADGLIAGSLIGSAGMLPRRYMQAIFAGTASSGTLPLFVYNKVFIQKSINM
ncbi:Equilibrative nucleotide transporter like [Thalictrum thalictroides]|uniref:Equilibrative nucleotide transporter like n=1 Tax=Thalictrum thalictroides TaxID=46969 RepID=A0A7J6URN0_THATH|nr:Equilibrative nucleotide transporter like [Thalictrum thalictroides]